MTITEYIDTARLALLRAENVEVHREIREREKQTNHAREFVNSTRLRHIRSALLALSQIEPPSAT